MTTGMKTEIKGMITEITGMTTGITGGISRQVGRTETGGILRPVYRVEIVNKTPGNPIIGDHTEPEEPVEENCATAAKENSNTQATQQSSIEGEGIITTGRTMQTGGTPLQVSPAEISKKTESRIDAGRIRIGRIRHRVCRVRIGSRKGTGATQPPVSPAGIGTIRKGGIIVSEGIDSRGTIEKMIEGKTGSTGQGRIGVSADRIDNKMKTGERQIELLEITSEIRNLANKDIQAKIMPTEGTGEPLGTILETMTSKLEEFLPHREAKIAICNYPAPTGGKTLTDSMVLLEIQAATSAGPATQGHTPPNTATRCPHCTRHTLQAGQAATQLPTSTAASCPKTTSQTAPTATEMMKATAARIISRVRMQIHAAKGR